MSNYPLYDVPYLVRDPNGSIISSFASIGRHKNEENMIFWKNFSLLMEH
jgi:hypothetical protein